MNPQTGTKLIYGECQEGLTFLEKSYVERIGDFKEALAKSSTWGELKSRIAEEDYLETVERWKDDQEDPETSDPKPEDEFDATRMSGYLDMDWPEFAPGAMDEWVSKEIIEEYGGYVQPMLDADFPLIAFENEEKVVSLLEGQGYICIRDDSAIWRAIFGE